MLFMDCGAEDIWHTESIDVKEYWEARESEEIINELKSREIDQSKGSVIIMSVCQVDIVVLSLL